VDGTGIQVRVGRAIEELDGHHQWRLVTNIPVVSGARLLMAAVAESPYQPGPDAAADPVFVLLKRGRTTVVGTFEADNGWRLHAFNLGAVNPVMVSDTTVAIRQHPLITITIAPTDDLVTETVYPKQQDGALNSTSPLWTTTHDGQIAAWSPSFYPGNPEPMFILTGTQVLGQTEEELLYRPIPHQVALVSYQPALEPLYVRVPTIAPAFKRHRVHQEPRGGTGYLIGRRWVDYQANDGWFEVAHHRYHVQAVQVLADAKRLWLIGNRAIWEVRPTGAPLRIGWPAGLGPRYGDHWLQDVYGVTSGTWLYVAVGQEVRDSESEASQISPWVRASLVAVQGRRAQRLAEYPVREGAVTSLALGPDSTLYLAFYTGHHNVDYQYNMAGRGEIVGYQMSRRRWESVTIPARFYRPQVGHSLLGQSIISLVVLPGPRFYFLVQFNPNGQGGGFGTFVWEWHHRVMHFFDMPLGSLEYAFELAAAPEGGVLVNSGDTLAWIRPHRGLAYLGEPGASWTQWLGTSFLEESFDLTRTLIDRVQTEPLRPTYLLKLTGRWPFLSKKS
jgi:hypothetical protein